MKKDNNDDRSTELNPMVELAQKGDPIAYGKVCKMFIPLIEYQARAKIVQDLFGEDALGIVWVAFLEVLRKKQLARCNVAGYVAVALKYAVLKKVKEELSLRSKVRCEEEVLLMKAEAEAAGLEALWEREEFMLEVKNSKALSETEKEILLKLLQEGYDFQTLAQEQGAKLKTLHKTFERALKKLRKLLKEE